jgi:hypothetical protein
VTGYGYGYGKGYGYGTYASDGAPTNGNGNGKGKGTQPAGVSPVLPQHLAAATNGRRAPRRSGSPSPYNGT